MTEALRFDTFDDPALVKARLREIERLAVRPIRLMEVCGTHTMALFRSGLRQALRQLGVELLSGPGCPVCVTPQADIDFILALAARPGSVIGSFGDMLRVPGSRGSLAELKTAGADVRVVYSPLDAVAFAAGEPDKQVVFLGIGFETTAPAVAQALLEARRQELRNYFTYPAHKTIPQALLGLARDPALRLDGFLCPGHVSAVTGLGIYEAVARQAGKPCVVGGFEPLDLVEAVLLLVRQIASGEARVENAYPRVVRPAGNPAAQALIAQVFEPCDAQWRGLGAIAGSGLQLRAPYAACDARTLLPDYLPLPPDPRLAQCRCGEVLKGLCEPPGCPAYGTACTPEQPLGACMVSQEGACRAYYRYAQEAL